MWHASKKGRVNALDLLQTPKTFLIRAIGPAVMIH
jgi:hypothetical protein